jgi:cytochrome c oxidase assembly protein subunit 11
MSGDPKSRSRRPLVFKLVTGTVFMFAFSFALVPLYDVMCDALGIGKIRPSSELSATSALKPHALTVEFVTTNNGQLDWSFYPLVKSLEVQTSQTYSVNFLAKNNTDKTMTVQAIPSITPIQGTDFLHKTQCFCFERQTLEPGESIKMPVVFLIDSSLPTRYKTLTLAYSLFELEESASVKVASTET